MSACGVRCQDICCNEDLAHDFLLCGESGLVEDYGVCTSFVPTFGVLRPVLLQSTLAGFWFQGVLKWITNICVILNDVKYTSTFMFELNLV